MVALSHQINKDAVLELDKLWQEHWGEYSLPDRRNSITDAVTRNENGRIIGYGQVKLFAEAMLFIDPTARQRDKAKSVQYLMHEAFRGVEEYGLHEMYAFIKNPDFSQLIQKRYGFHSVPEPGELLLRSL